MKCCLYVYMLTNWKAVKQGQLKVWQRFKSPMWSSEDQIFYLQGLKVPKSSISKQGRALSIVHLSRVLWRYFWTHPPTMVVIVQKREFRKAFWFWKWNQNCQNCLSCTLKLIVHSWYTASPEPREMQKQKLRKSEKKNWGNLKNVKREENSTACENASCA